MQNGHGPSSNGSAAIELRRQLYAALPGDTLRLTGEDGPRTITTALLCTETIESQTTEWRWLFLDDDSLLEAAPKGIFRYTRHQRINHGTHRFQELVAQDGALVRFEKRVQAGTAAQRPVHLTIDGAQYRVAYTGTATAQRLGIEPTLGPWRGFHSDASKNVFFGLAPTAEGGEVILGLWTEDVSLSFGRPLGPAEITVIPPSG